MKHFFFLVFFCSPVFAENWSIQKDLTLQKLRTYCKACHAVEAQLRFIKNENNDDLWHTLYNERSPKSGKLWVDKIIEVLSWPSDTAPAFDAPLSSTNDWMPKGYKRIQLSEDYTSNESTRHIILDTLKAGP